MTIYRSRTISYCFSSSWLFYRTPSRFVSMLTVGPKPVLGWPFSPLTSWVVWIKCTIRKANYDWSFSPTASMMVRMLITIRLKPWVIWQLSPLTSGVVGVKWTIRKSNYDWSLSSIASKIKKRTFSIHIQDKTSHIVSFYIEIFNTLKNCYVAKDAYTFKLTRIHKKKLFLWILWVLQWCLLKEFTYSPYSAIKEGGDIELFITKMQDISFILR